MGTVLEAHSDVEMEVTASAQGAAFQHSDESSESDGSHSDSESSEEPEEASVAEGNIKDYAFVMKPSLYLRGKDGATFGVEKEILTRFPKLLGETKVRDSRQAYVLDIKSCLLFEILNFVYTPPRCKYEAARGNTIAVSSNI